MTAVAEPTARRLRRPSWRDPRLLIGVAMVLLATALGAMGLRAADSRVPVYAARAVLLPGERLSLDKLVRVDVQLSGAGTSYFAAGDGLPSEGYVLREVRAGELIPKSAVGRGTEIAVAPLSVSVDLASSGALVTGSTVDVYANKSVDAVGTSKSYAGPERVLSAVHVARVTTASGFGATSGRSAVQLLVPAAEVARVIALVDDGAKFTLVPVPGSPLREAS